MKKHRLYTVLIICSFISTGCAITPQKMLSEKGWVPLDTFDLTQFEKNKSNEKCNSDFRPELIGRVLPFTSLRDTGFIQKTYTLPTSKLVFASNIDLSACYTSGPQNVFESSDYKISLADINIDKFATAGITFEKSSDIEIKNVRRAYASMNDAQKLKLLQKLDTDNSAVFIITDALIGDITNAEKIFTKVGAEGKIKASEFDITIQQGDQTKKEKISGLSLILAIRGNVLKRISSHRLNNLQIPEPGESIEIQITKDNKLKIIRVSNTELDFRMNGGSYVQTYSRVDGEWQEDMESKLALLPSINHVAIENTDSKVDGTYMAKAESFAVSIVPGKDTLKNAAKKEMTAAQEGKSFTEKIVDITDIRIVFPSADGVTNNVIAFYVTGNKMTGKFSGEGHVYTIKSAAINSVEDYINCKSNLYN